MTSRRRRRAVAAAAGLAAVAWAAAAALALLSARDHAARGTRAVAAARDELSLAALVHNGSQGRLSTAHAAFAAAESRLGSLVLAPVRILPVAGRQLRSAHALAAAAADVTDVAGDASGRARTLLADADAGPAGRVELLRQLGELAGSSERRLAGLQLGPRHALVRPLAERREELLVEVGAARRALADAAAVAGGLARFLEGPRRYLLFAANNAEMRAGAGMLLSVAELSVAGGRLDVSPFQATADLGLPDELAPPIGDADLADRWGWLEPQREWRNLLASPRFAASAELAAAMWSARGGAPPDGVLAVDVAAVAAVLRATGPVEYPGGRVSADEATQLLLYEQYLRAEFAGEAAHRELNGALAGAVFARLGEGNLDLAALAAGLRDAAAGRHLLAWSAREDDGALWERAGMDGRLRPASLLVSVLNRGGNKLDQFLEVGADLALEPDGTARLAVSLRNAAPADAPPYVAGPHPALDVGPGDYTGILAVTLPGGSRDPAVEGASGYLAAGDDGPAEVVAVPVEVRRGGEHRLVVRFRLPAPAVRVEPSARIPPVRWTAQGRTWEDRAAVVLRW